MKIFLFLALLFSTQIGVGQEINASVSLIYTSEKTSNKNIYKSLEKSILKYLNGTSWTGRKVDIKERIEASFIINIRERISNNRFKADIQIQSRRPVFGSTYYSPIINLRDSDFTFEYVEFETLLYNPSVFESNLTSVLAYYAYLIIGMDADTFSSLGGTPFFKKARDIINLAQSSEYKGWSSLDGQKNRFTLIDNAFSSEFIKLRRIYYIYHRRGLDIMYENEMKVQEGKKQIADAISKLKNFKGRLTSAYLLQLFMQTKADELVKIYSAGPKTKTNMIEFKSTLNSLYPSYSQKWSKIKA